MSSDVDSEGRTLTGGLSVSQQPAEIGWNKIREDMLRPPDEPGLFAMVTGIGSQVGLTVYIGILLMCIFYTHPSIRPWTLTAGLFLFACCGFINGYMTTRMLKFFGIEDWR